jgi:beta-glucosidase
MTEKKREQKIKELISKMTAKEKVSQLLHQSPAIPRLGIPEYNWWNEALHGIARAGGATVFPQAIGLSATFDPQLIKRIASAISDEARAKYNLAVKNDLRIQYHGLTFWTPNINIFRDPRWGRGQETYGEDPVLAGLIGCAFVEGLQGENPEQLKTAACAKHFAVHSGPEKIKHSFNAVPGMKDLYETYLPAFKALVDSGVESVMSAYNRTLDEACSASSFLMEEILRGKWKFKGHYVSDCWAIRDFHTLHGLTETPEESAALALNRGCDLNCGCVYEALCSALEQGLVDESKIDESLTRLLRTRFKLGMFDKHGTGPYDKIKPSVIRCREHIDLALESAHKSIVLLKNDSDILPLNREKKRILLIGPGAANLHCMLGNYHGMSPRIISVLEGLTEKIISTPQITMDYQQGCLMYSENRNTGWTVGMADKADVVVAVFGLDSAFEGEDGDTIASDAVGDRKHIRLPPWQLDYLKALRSRGKPLVLILTGGSPISVPYDIADAVLFIWYPGEQGGRAVADVLFGDVSPSGKLPVTFPHSVVELPSFDDYNMEGRTYRYMRREPLFPFGFGLTYTEFEFKRIRLSSTQISTGENVKIDTVLVNKGSRDSGQVIQVYIEKEDKNLLDPNFSLKAFKRVFVEAGKSMDVNFILESCDFETVNEAGEYILIPGKYRITIADSSPFLSVIEKGAVKPVSVVIEVK